MADSAKREKIAAARKKLKQFKQKGGRNSPATKSQNTNEMKTSNAVSGPQGDQVNSKEMNSVVNNCDEDRSESPNDDARTSSSTESLHQLSRQINGLLSESNALVDGEDGDNSNVEELERRNRELAALLEKHSKANEQLNTQIEQVREYAKNLQQQLEKERDTFTDKQKQEVGPLKEQLQVHIQTIGILVAEKTELQSQLGQAQKISEQRFDEIEELSGRLKASRQRVADLERNLSTTTNSSQQFQQNSKDLAKDNDRLKLELYKSNKSQEELTQQNTELGEKLQAKASECVGLEQSVEDLKRKVEMAELYAHQLSSQSEDSQESLKIVSQLQSEKDELQAKVQEFNEAFQKISTERDQIAEQYQHYIDQLQHQCQDLTQQITSLTDEREQLVTRQHELEGATLELQRKLEDASLQNSADTDEADRSEIQTELESLRIEYLELGQRHEAQIRDNAQLSRFLEEKEDKITELENTLADYSKEEGEKTLLLENIQSDKTALSRALTQNKDLKVQLAELQNGFVKMSNDHMEVMTKLQSEQHRSSELQCRLGQQEDEIKQIREVLSQKEALLSEIEQYSHLEKKEIHQQEQIHDRLRHYEAQAQLTETLQRELQNSQDMVDALTTQNSELRTMLIKMSDRKAPEHITEEDQKRDDLVDSLTTAINQLESERNQLVQNLKDQRDLSDSLSVKVADMEEELAQTNSQSTDNDRITRKEYDQLKNSMELIQEKYTRVMRDKADLTDKAEELEHIVLQLQGETDTIGEYISLYHHQRALLQQRELQKNDYIAHLARDREQLQAKLGELQVLVMQLLGEKNMLHNYNEESQLLSPDVSIQPHLAKTEVPLTNGINNQPPLDWPDYTSSESDTESEVETIVGGKDNLADNHEPHDHTQHNHHHHHVPKRERTLSHASRSSDIIDSHRHVHDDHTGHTAHRILDLLSEIGSSNLVDTIVDHNFLPCKYCKGQVQIV